MINTLAKQITPSQMGITMYHEHLTIDLSRQKSDSDAKLTGDLLLKDLSRIKEFGVKTIIELSNIGMGRNLKRMQELAAKFDFNIIASTGFYKEPYLPEIFYQKNADQLTSLMISEIKNGIEGTNIKAGVIGEIGSSKEFTPAEKKLFKAAAQAQQQTGVPIITHLTLGSCGLEQLEILTANGADLNKVAFSHLDLAEDIDYILKIAERGVFIGIDTIGKLKYQTDQFRVKIVQELIKAGFSQQILLSTDLTRLSHLTANGGHGYQYLFDSFIPQLEAAGLSKVEIEAIITDNPARLFS